MTTGSILQRPNSEKYSTNDWGFLSELLGTGCSCIFPHGRVIFSTLSYKQATFHFSPSFLQILRHLVSRSIAHSDASKKWKFNVVLWPHMVCPLTISFICSRISYPSSVPRCTLVYSDFRLCNFFTYEYIRTFVWVKIFRSITLWFGISSECHLSYLGFPVGMWPPL